MAVNLINSNDIEVIQTGDNITLNLSTTYNTNLTNRINSVVESGNNSNGNYIKYNDGTMICYREVTNTISCNTSWGSLYYGVDNTVYNFAQEFVSTPTVLTDIQSTTGTGLLDAKYNPLSVSTTSVSDFSIVRPTSNAGVGIRIVILAIGKWK